MLRPIADTVLCSKDKMNRQLNSSKIIHGALMSSGAVAMLVLGVYMFLPSDEPIDQGNTGAVISADLEEDKVALITKPDAPAIISSSTVQLKAGLDALKSGDILAAIKTRDELPEADIDRALLSWLIATSGHKDVPASEIRNTLEKLKDWPSQTTMKSNLERAMAQDPLSLVRLRLTIGDEAPLTFQGAYALAKTYQATGNIEKARALLLPFWHDTVLSASDESRILETFGDVLTKRDHEIRYFNMMVRDRISSGGRIAPFLDYGDIHDAWTAVIRRQKAARGKIDKITENNQKTVAYAYLKTEFLRRSDENKKAIELLKSMPKTAEFTINADAWWDERRIISRQMLEDGDPQTAYDLASQHEGGAETTQVDAAFHAGWYALRGLKKPELAVSHFEKIIEIAQGNISKARGYYWLARSLADQEKSKQAYQKAATYNTTFYGQLAADHLGQPSALSGRPVTRDKTVDVQTLKAIDRLIDLGETNLARKTYVALGWSADDTSLLALAAAHASDNQDYYAALKLAKAADWRGLDMGSLTHPLGAISDATGLDAKDHALAYAVARQESEFNIGAVSSANARGLLQVLPGTAKQIAAAEKMAYAPEKLTQDANYNARLGVAYLNSQFQKFDGSYILTFAAYNAGPRRAEEWMKRFGDPRGKPLYEVIDWIEAISYPETRNYVQRLMENLQVYKMQLGQKTSITHDLRFGTNP